MVEVWIIKGVKFNLTYTYTFFLGKKRPHSAERRVLSSQVIGDKGAER
jgi:hypothetical protein